MSDQSISTSTDNIDRSWLVRLRSGPNLFWLLALLVQLPLLANYLVWIWQFEHYQYFPFLLLAVAWLGWSRLVGPIQYPVGKLSAGLFMSSMLVLLFGSMLDSAWFASVSFFLLAASFLVTHRLAYLCVPLVLLIRLPMNYDVQIISGLQALTTRLSSYILDLLYIPHLARGNVIELADRELFVAEACSGVQSAFTIAFIALLMAAWYRRPLSLIPIYLFIALVWAVLCNTLRVTTIAYAAARYQVDLSAGVAHDILGYSTLLLAILLTWSTDSLLQFIFHSISDEATERFNLFIASWEWLVSSGTRDSERSVTPAPSIESPEGKRGWQRLLFGPRRVATIGILGIGLATSLPLAARAISTPQIVNPEGNVLFAPPPTLLNDLDGPAKFEFLSSVRESNDPTLGKNADQWKMKLGELEGTLVFSQPYPEWHDLNMCYRAQGWRMIKAAVLRPGDMSKDRAMIPFSMHARSDDAIGNLFVACVRADGSIVAPAAQNIVDRMIEKWRQPRVMIDNSNLFSGEYAMIQIWLVTNQELDDETIQNLANSLAQVRDRFASAIKESRLSSSKQ